MSDDRGEATASDTAADRIREFLDAFGVLTPVVVALLVFIWLLLPLIPEDSGIAFGLWFRVFFTWILLAATAFFWRLDLERVPAPRSGGAALGSVGAVYFVTVAVLVGVGLALPQFEGRGPRRKARRSPRRPWRGARRCSGPPFPGASSVTSSTVAAARERRISATSPRVLRIASRASPRRRTWARRSAPVSPTTSLESPASRRSCLLSRLS